MEKSIEATGRTEEDAISAALSQLGLTRDEVSVEILERSKSGFLGIGSSPARVRVSYEAKEEREEKMERLISFLEGLFQRMDVKVSIAAEMSEDGDTISVVLSGPSVGAVIGRRGETLDAIQHLSNYVINAASSERIRVNIDAENYRAKRADSLTSLAKKTAAKVLKYRRSMTLEPMNAYERHVIHTALQDYEGVTTYSTGTEPNRRVVVAYERGAQESGSHGGARTRGERAQRGESSDSAARQSRRQTNADRPDAPITQTPAAPDSTTREWH